MHLASKRIESRFLSPASRIIALHMFTKDLLDFVRHWYVVLIEDIFEGMLTGRFDSQSINVFAPFDCQVLLSIDLDSGAKDWMYIC